MGAIVAITGIITKVDIGGIPVEVYAAIVSFVLFIVVSLLTKKPESNIQEKVNA